MDYIQLAPNGKIYGSTYNGGLKALHVINYPNLKGDSCKFVYGGQPTLTLNSDVLPNMINYNLGPLGSSTYATMCRGNTYNLGNKIYMSPGVYNDTLNSVSGCDSIVTLHLQVFPFTEPQISLTGKDTLSTTAFSQYQWLMNGEPLAGATTNRYIAPDTGTYAVVIVDTNGCFDTSASYYFNSLATKNISSSEFVSLYPNPAKDEIYLNFYAQTSGIVNFEMLDQLGQPVVEQNLGTGQNVAQFSTSNLSNSICYWRLQDSERTIRTGVIAIIK
jgi:hypothetical protein